MFLLFLVLLFISYSRPAVMEKAWLHWAGIISIPIVWICSQAGWIVAEVGRQPWVIQDVMPRGVAISDIGAGGVQATFIVFAAIFTLLLIAEISIMLRFIGQSEKTNIEQPQNA